MKPKLETFRKAVFKAGGNLTKVASLFKVTRSAVYDWCRKDPKFREVLQDERGSLVDDCKLSARLLARGIPAIDESGNFTGWIERPDPNMVRYILSTLGRKEGFGEEDEEEIQASKGIEINRWIDMEMGIDDNK